MAGRLVLLHGLGSSGAMWKGLGREVGVPVEAPDLPWAWMNARGWGRSTGDDVGRVDEAFDAQDVVVAHSFSATLLLSALARRPAERQPRAVVLVSPFYLGAGQEITWQETGRLLDGFEGILRSGIQVQAGRRIREENLSAMASQIRDAIGVPGWLRFIEAYAATSSLDLARLAGPTAVVHGLLDSASPSDASRRLCTDLHRCRSFMLPASGHFPMIEDPPGFAAALQLAFSGLYHSAERQLQLI